MPLNALGQPVGENIGPWLPPPRPQAQTLQGVRTRLHAVRANRDGPGLYHEVIANSDIRDWTYMPQGPFRDEDEWLQWFSTFVSNPELVTYAIQDPQDGRFKGLGSYLRIREATGCIEIGYLFFGHALQRTPAATEAIFLLLDHAFELGYRRCEWKCDALNERSRRAATRYGFEYEGTFRQATLYKQRNRDTAWFAITDRRWQLLKPRFQRWLSDENFDGQGRQLLSLRALTASIDLPA